MSKSISSIKTSDTNEPSLDNPVYKVKQLINGSINTIYVFNGKISEENKFKSFCSFSFTDNLYSGGKYKQINFVFIWDGKKANV